MRAKPGFFNLTALLPARWLLFTVVALAALLLTCWPQGLQDFRYERNGLLSGQWWLLLTAHLVHLNPHHLLLNLFALALICELLGDDLPLAHGMGLLSTAAMGVSALLWWRHPELQWYAGLSGALHGLWAGGAMAALRRAAAGIGTAGQIGYHCLAAGAAGLLMVKLLLEWHLGAATAVTDSIAGPVVTVAHFYGTLAGAVYWLAWRGMEHFLRKNKEFQRGN